MTITNSLFSGNTAIITGGALHFSGTSSVITNSIIWGNHALSSPQIRWHPTVQYSIIEGGFQGVGNLELDPKFVNADGPDDIPGTADDHFQLLPQSPAIDAGDSNVDTDISVAGIQLLPKTDLAGNTRFVDDSTTPDVGNLPSPIIDIGPYEFLPAGMSSIFFVDSTTDSVDINPGDGLCEDGLGNCTLRAAIMESNVMDGENSVFIPPGHYVLTLGTIKENLAAEGDLDIRGDITIIGSGNNISIIDGGGIDRVFEVFETIKAEFGAITITGGKLAEASGVPSGGGIRNNGKTTLKDCSIEKNSTPKGAGGGIINFGGQLSIYRSKIVDNTSRSQGAGIYSPSGTLFIRDSLIAGNATSTTGGGIHNHGKAFIFNSTITENSGSVGGAINNNAGGDLTLVNCTITNNSVSISTDAGGIVNFEITKLKNTIVAGNGIDTQSAFNFFTSLGNNIIGNRGSSTEFLDGRNNDVIGTNSFPVDPQISLLQDNGGIFPTYALLPGSPAIDAGDNSIILNSLVEGPPFFDQRGKGFIRFFDGNADGAAVIDIGSFEFAVTPKIEFLSSNFAISETGGVIENQVRLVLPENGANDDSNSLSNY